MKYKWEIKIVRYGEEKEYLDEGWEPFAISAHDTSYQYYNTTKGVTETEHQTTDYIYLRRKVIIH